MSQAPKWTKISQGHALKRSSVYASAVGSTIYAFGGELEPRQPRDNDTHKIMMTKECHADNSDKGRVREKFYPSLLPNTLRLLVWVQPRRPFEARYTCFLAAAVKPWLPLTKTGHLWALDPSSDTWSSLPPSSSDHPEARSYHCMTSDGQDTIYVHAGCPEKGRLSDLWAFSVSKASWKRLAPAPDPPRGGTSTAIAEDKIYRMNGFDGKQEQGGSLDVYDTATDRWSTISFSPDGKSGPGPRGVAALIPVHTNGSTSLVTLFGECDPSSLGHQGAGKMLSDVWAYSLKDGKWAQVNAEGEDGIPEARGWFDADVINIDGKEGIIVLGGLGESNDQMDDAWLLSIV